MEKDDEVKFGIGVLDFIFLMLTLMEMDK